MRRSKERVNNRAGCKLRTIVLISVGVDGPDTTRDQKDDVGMKEERKLDLDNDIK